MTGPGYLKWTKSAKGKSTAAATAPSGRPVQEAQKKRRLDVSEDVSAPSATVAVASVSPLPAPPVVQTSTISASRPPSSTSVVSLEHGELWRRGLNEDLRGVINPPVFDVGSAMSGDTLTALWHMQEESLKAASMISAFEVLHQKHVALTTEHSALKEKSESFFTRYHELKKENAQLAKHGVEYIAKVDSLTADLAEAVEGRAKAASEVEEARRAAARAEAELTVRNDRLQKLEAEYAALQAELDEAREGILKVAEESFENAISQAKVLNPELQTAGIDLNNYVEGDRIVSYSAASEEVEVEADVAGVADPEVVEVVPPVDVAEDAPVVEGV